MKATLKNVNKMAAKYDCSFHRGPGYYYFTPNSSGCFFFEEGVYSGMQLAGTTVAEWERELVAKIDEAKANFDWAL